MSSSRARIFLIDDHPIVVEAYRLLIGREREFEVCGVAATALVALKKVKLIRPDLCVVDLMLHDGNGLDLIKSFHALYPEMKLLVVSARDETVFAERALHAGAMGYLNKDQPTEKLLEAIHHVLDGKIYLSEEMTDRILHRASLQNGDLQHSLVEQLADRELETFELIGRGMTTREVASQMSISPKTVDRYRENIKEKLKLPNATELLRRATIWVEENS